MQNDPIGSRSTGGHLERSSINIQRTDIVFIRFLAYFPEANLSSTSLSSIFWKNSKIFHQQPENIQRLFRLQNCLRRKSSAPENIQRLFRLQNCLSRKSSAPESIQRLSDKQQPAKAISSSNQQKQSAAAISSSNQQKQSTATFNSGNQQQQSAAGISSSNQHQRPSTAISIHPTSSTYTIHDDFR